MNERQHRETQTAKHSPSRHDADPPMGTETSATVDGRPAGATASKQERSPAESTPPPSPPPPRGPRLRHILLALLAAGAILAIGVLGADSIKRGWGAAMSWLDFGHEHEHEHSAVAVMDGEGNVQYWTCGMHPWIILPEPGLCPICHMDLTPLDTAKLSGEIVIDPIVVQNIGVRVQDVVEGPVVRKIRTVGAIAYDERRVRDINTKVAGWIEELFVDYEGAKVQAGDPLFELYSPQLYAAQEEYLIAYRNRDRGTADTSGSGGMLESARTRLEYFDISDQQIETLQERGTPTKTLMIRTPYDGYVIEKHANEGMQIAPGMRVYRIADLSKVWVMVTVYEDQLPFVEVGQPATMKLPYMPGESFEGEVTYIDPYVNPRTREVQVRLEFDNPNERLKPGMFANIHLRSTLDGERTLAPRAAIMDTGERQLVFVSLGAGKFEPREIRMGIEAEGGMVEVLEGLEPGEKVVTSGQFLIDSESKMREALAKMVKGESAAEQEVELQVAGGGPKAALPAGASEAMNELLAAYFDIQNALASDTIDGVADAVERIATAAERLETLPAMADSAPPGLSAIPDAVAALAQATNVVQARADLVPLSEAVVALAEAIGVPSTHPQSVQRLSCPMYPEGEGGAVWLQPAGDVRNPYMGAWMLECHNPDTRAMLPVAGGSAADSVPATQPQPQTEDSTASDSEAEHVTLVAGPQEHIDQLTVGYFEISERLAKDSLEGVAERFRELAAISDALTETEDRQLTRLATSVGEAAAIGDRQLHDLDSARAAFKALSAAMIALIGAAPPNDEVASSLYVGYCPMADASWLQTEYELVNPYMGPAMLRCGSIEKTLKSGPEGDDSNRE